jgi:hypothetical protein
LEDGHGGWGRSEGGWGVARGRRNNERLALNANQNCCEKGERKMVRLRVPTLLLTTSHRFGTVRMASSSSANDLSQLSKPTVWQ